MTWPFSASTPLIDVHCSPICANQTLLHQVVLSLFTPLFWSCPLEENGVSDPTRTRVSFHPFPLSRCSVGCRWIGHGWLNYVWKSSEPSGQKRAKLCSKNTVRLYGHECASPLIRREQLSALKGSIRFDLHRWANSAHRCACSTLRSAKPSVLR